MTWNHRVVRTVSRDGEVLLALHEAFYAEGAEVPESITEEPVAVLGDDISGLRWTLENMLRALEKPILSYDDYHGVREI